MVEFSSPGATPGAFVVTRDGQLGGLTWWQRREQPTVERVAAGWHDGPSPTWLELSLVGGSDWSGDALQIRPVDEDPITYLEIFDYSYNKPEIWELLGPGDGRPRMRLKTCELTDDGDRECKTTQPLPRGCEPVGGWTGYWILACEDSGRLSFVMDWPDIMSSADRAEATRLLAGSDLEDVGWVATEDRLAWWSKATGLIVYEGSEKPIAEFPDVVGLTRATLDSELGLALVHTDGGVSILNLATAELGPPLATSIAQLTAAAFATKADAVAMTDGQRVSVYQLSTNTELSWAAVGTKALAWRQDSNVLFGSSVASGPEQAWDPQTGQPLESLSPELRARVATGQLDPTWRWAIIPGQPGEFLEIIRIVDGLTLYAGKGGAVLADGRYQRDSDEWFIDQWRIGFGPSALARDWRIETLTQHDPHGRGDLVVAFFAGRPIVSATPASQIIP